MKNSIRRNSLFIFFFITLVTFCNSSVSNDLNNKLKKKYCPLYDFKGKAYCLENGQKKSMMTIKGLPRDQIISGFGYDRMTRELKYPILASNPATRKSGLKKKTKKYKHVKFLFDDVILNNNAFTDKREVFGDVIVEKIENLKKISKGFTRGDADIGISSNIYYTHETSVKDVSNTNEEFEYAVKYMPPYNKNNQESVNYYRMMIRFFGTDVAVSSNYGGVVYQASMIKKCYKGLDKLDEDMLKDLDGLINNKKVSGSQYIQYRRLGMHSVHGGNPEIMEASKIKERIATFAQAPVPVHFHTEPLWSFVKNDLKRFWMANAIRDYWNENKKTTDAIIKEINEEEQKVSWEHQNIYVFTTVVEQKGNTDKYQIADTSAGCPKVRIGKKWNDFYVPRCALINRSVKLKPNELVKVAGSQRTSWAGAEDIVIQRSGFIANQVRILHWTHPINPNSPKSPWISNGCTSIRNNDARFKRYMCVGEHPFIKQSPALYNQIHTDFQFSVCDNFGVK